jgi:NACalpha-BTF3-like transcription factor
MTEHVNNFVEQLEKDPKFMIWTGEGSNGKSTLSLPTTTIANGITLEELVTMWHSISDKVEVKDDGEHTTFSIKFALNELPQIENCDYDGDPHFLQFGSVNVKKDVSPEEEKEKDIALVTRQTDCPREKVVSALERHNWDIVEAIIDLTVS